MTVEPLGTTHGRRSVGTARRRVEDRALLTGTAQFVDDIAPAGCLHAAFLRSPVAHGLLRSVDMGAAADAPDVLAVFAAADVDLPPLQPPIENPAARTPSRPLLARDRVRFVGEPLAVAVGESPYAAEDAVELIGVDIEELDAVVDVDIAAGDGAEPVHPPGTNVLYDSSIDIGDVDAAFRDAAIVVEREFRNPRVAPVPLESRGILAQPDGDGVRVWSSSQAPHKLQQVLAELLGIARDRVRVACPDIGGGFGQKAHAYPEDVLVAWLALRLRQPVKWVEDRSENLLAASHARDQRVRVRACADGEGRLLAIEADVVCDQGAYGVYPHGHILEALGTPAMIPGPYRLSHYRARSRSVATNKCPEGAYRGVGLPVSAFVHERLMDIIAGRLAIDRAKIRLRNLLTADELPYTTVTNQRYDSGDYGRALRVALEAVGYDGFVEQQRLARSDGRLIGLGLSCYVEYTGINSRVFSGRGMVGIAGFDDARIALDADGRARVWTTLPAIGQGVETTFAQLTADALGIDVERVVVARTDTAAAELHGTGAFASRSAVSGGGAILEAGGELRRRLVAAAAERLEAAAVDLRVAGDRVEVAGSPSRSVTIGDLVADGGEAQFTTVARFDPPAVAYPYATHACRVEVDGETGEVVIDRYVIVEDCGRIVNPLIVDGQAHGAAAQGIGGTLFESMVYADDGQLQTASLADYLLPTAAETPVLEVTHLEIPAPEAPFGAKGVGEGGTLAPPGAIANAVGDALGVECNVLPLSPERVRAAAVAAGSAA